MAKNKLKDYAEQKALLFPALTPGISGKRVYFLFSVHQVEDIMRQATVEAVPFAPPYIAGITAWREEVLPVIKLESCLGMKTDASNGNQRWIVVRTAWTEPANGIGVRCVLRTHSAMQMVSLPIQCTPVTVGSWIPRHDLLRGLYEGKERFLVLVHMGRILNSKTPLPTGQEQKPQLTPFRNERIEVDTGLLRTG